MFADRKIIVLYHENPLTICPDGMACRYIAWKKFDDNATYLPVRYGKPMPEFPRGKDVEVYILDFSYSWAELEKLRLQVGRLIVIDHHSTAQDDLEDLDYAYFDMSKAGCMGTLKYFFPFTKPSQLLNYIQDRDMWWFNYTDTRAITAAIYNSDQNDSMDFWSRLDNDIEFCYDQIKIGETILMANRSEIKEFMTPRRQCFKIKNIEGKRVAIYNTTTLISEKAEAILNKEELNVDYVMSYLIDSEGCVNFSFRALKDRTDVGEVAKRYGGGGRQQTAGANLPGEKGHQILSQLLLLDDIPNVYC